MTVKKEVVSLSRDVLALMVPSGARIMLHQDTEVTITQSLGNAFTVSVYGNLARIDGKDADALGKVAADPLADLPPDSSIQDQVWAMLRLVYDPEIPVNIVDLGLVYACDVTEKDGEYWVAIRMTLTAPGCGMGPVIAADAQDRVRSIPKVADAEIELVFDPPWDRSMMSDEARLELGLLD